jgi:hypothetical protein
MFKCERCGSSYSASRAAAVENCPRCRARDRVSAPLRFKMFDLPGSEGGAAPGDPPLAPLTEDSACQRPQSTPQPSPPTRAPAG